MASNAPTGHIKIARKAFDAEHGDAFWLEERAFSKWEAWVDMIQLAQWTARDLVTTKFGTIRLNRGEFVLSIRQMAARWGWSIQSVRTFTKSAVFLTRLLAQRETQAGTVYLIVNYDKYQSRAADTNTATNTGSNRPSTHLQHTSNTRTSSKAGKAITTQDQLPLPDSTANPSDAERVLAHYVAVHPRRRIGPKHRKAVANALTQGYTADELCEAIDGNAHDDWHIKIKKHDLAYVLRDSGYIDDFIARREAQNPLITDENGEFTAAGLALLNGKP